MARGKVGWMSEDSCVACGKPDADHQFSRAQVWEFRNYSSTYQPTKFDWGALGAVTDVKDTGDCASTWAFAAAGDIEGTQFLSTDDALASLSAQQLDACDTLDDGCLGGDAFGRVELWLYAILAGLLFRAPGTWLGFWTINHSGVQTYLIALTAMPFFAIALEAIFARLGWLTPASLTTPEWLAAGVILAGAVWLIVVRVKTLKPS